jgi:hypothetical protein
MKLSEYNLFMPIYGCAKVRWKISKNKICHLWQTPLDGNWPLCETSFLILTDIKIRFKKNLTFSQSAQ